MERPFSPGDGRTVGINISAASQSTLVTAERGVTQIRVMNNGSATVWIRAGGSTVVATTSDLPIGPGITEVLSFGKPYDGDMYIAAIGSGATGYIYFTPGSGV